jgi:lysophospholipase L1-like esterase
MNFRYAAVVALSLAALCARAADVGHSAAASASAATASAQTASGPTPFPKDAKDWPGKGAIRVFGYMNDNRAGYWRERERKQGSVVFAGDSLVGGWQSLAADLPGVPVANRGIGGEPTRGLLFRFKEDVLDLHPKAIVLLTGSNDLSARQDVQQTRSNLVEMLEMAARASPDVPIVLCTLPPRDIAASPIDPSQLLELNKLIGSVAQGRSHVVVLDLYTLLADPDGKPHAEYFAADRGHLAAAGFKRFRDALVPVLQRLNVM